MFALAALSVGVGALYLSYDIGSAVAAKTRLSDAADTAAYSAAVWRARALNFAAYGNRAIIAQEVAVAQALTRQSWIAYFERFTDTVAEVAQIFPPAYAIAEGVHEAVPRPPGLGDPLVHQRNRLAVAVRRLRPGPPARVPLRLAHEVERTVHHGRLRLGARRDGHLALAPPGGVGLAGLRARRTTVARAHDPGLTRWRWRRRRRC